MKKSKRGHTVTVTTTGIVKETKTDADGTFHFSLLNLEVDDYPVPPGTTPAEQAAYQNIVQTAWISLQQRRKVEVVSQDWKSDPPATIDLHLKVLSIRLLSQQTKKRSGKLTAHPRRATKKSGR